MITSRDNFSIIKLNFETRIRQDVTIDMQRELRRQTFTIVVNDYFAVYMYTNVSSNMPHSYW